MTMLGKHQSEEARRKVANYRRGKHLTVEAKEKLSKFHKGKILSEETRKKMSIAKTGENNPNYGKSPSLKTRNKIRKTRLKEKHWNWKGGVTPDNKKIRVSIMTLLLDIFFVLALLLAIFWQVTDILVR